MDSRLVILGVFIILLIVTIFVGRRNARKGSSRPNRYRGTDYRSDLGFDSTEYGTAQHKGGGHHGGDFGGGHH